MKIKTKYLLILLIIIGAILRFYNLNWGAPFYFHPDERNIATSVAQLRFPEQMNPNFFAYGSLPIYTIYFTGLIKNLLISCNPLAINCQLSTVTFEHALVISRIYSALLSTLLIPLLFVIARSLATKQSTENQNSPMRLPRSARNDIIGLLTAFFATSSVGFIQFAHFGTFEMWLTFFTTLLFWLCLRTIRKRTISDIFLLALVSGILVATKISHLVILPLPVIAILSKDFQYYRLLFRTKRDGHGEFDAATILNTFRSKISLQLQHFVKILIRILFFAAVTLLVYFLSNPYIIFDYQSFLNSMKYESGLAIGSLPVFYTQSFYGTIPIVFQFNRVFPFIINPLLTSMFLPAFFYVIFLAFKKRFIGYHLLVISFLLLFLSQAFLFAKWTRYMVPTLPFIYLIIASALEKIYSSSEAPAKLRSNNSTMKQFNNMLGSRQARTIILTIILFVSVVFGVSYFITAFVRPDTRIEGSEFVKLNVPFDSKAMSEPYDLGLTPFNLSSHINMFNFYELDNNSPEFTEQRLSEDLQTAEYFIMPSQRLLISRLPNKKKFPNGNVFYSGLITSGEWEKIYQTPCDIFCRIAYLGNPVFRFEETAMVFDRPTVMIFKKSGK